MAANITKWSEDDNAALLVVKSLSASVSENGTDTLQRADDNPESASSPMFSDDAEESKPGNRKSRNLEKQRARRAMKRRQKQEVEAIESASTQGDVKREAKRGQVKRHRPTQVERSMNFFMTMSDWSRFFLRSETWLPRLNAGGKLDLETAESISKVVKRCWISGGGPSGFKSLEELERLVELKEKEASYIEKQLNRMLSLQDEAWKSYLGELERLFRSRGLLRKCLVGQPSFSVTRFCRVLRPKSFPCERALGRLEFYVISTNGYAKSGIVRRSFARWFPACG